jgi:hypothetical protein
MTMPEAKTTGVDRPGYKAALDKFDAALCEAIAVSQASSGRLPEPNVGYASHVFTQLCGAGISMIRAAPLTRWVRSDFDDWRFGSVSGHARSLVDGFLLFNYLIEPAKSEAELKTRINVMHLNDCTRRIELHTNLGFADDLEGFEKQREELRERLKGNDYFMALPGPLQKNCLNGKFMTIDSRDETYTATQLDIDLRPVALGTDCKLSEEELAAATKLARTPDEEALKAVTPMYFPTGLAEAWEEGARLLPQIPEVAGAIARLTERPEIARWVETGLELHEHSDNCEFCGNGLATQRLTELRSHFSIAQADFKSRVEAALARAKSSRLSITVFSPFAARDVYPQYRENAEAALAALGATMEAHNKLVDRLEAALSAKLTAPFTPSSLEALAEDPAAPIKAAFDAVETALAEHNAIANNFKPKKAEATKNARLHYAQIFDDT